MPRQQHLVLGEEASPEQIVAAAQRDGCRSTAYTYTEPTVFFEYTYDTARLAREAGLANIYISNGYMTNETLETLHPYLDAINVDLKAFRAETYRKYVGAKLQPVLDTLKWVKKHGIWLEVTTLVIPDINDDPAELNDVAEFVASELGVDTPWHISRFFPAYKMMDVPPTPLATLQLAREIGLKKGLRYVYEGNLLESEGENTYCYKCGSLLIRRRSYTLLGNKTVAGHCYHCGAEIDGVGI